MRQKETYKKTRNMCTKSQHVSRKSVKHTRRETMEETPQQTNSIETRNEESARIRNVAAQG